MAEKHLTEKGWKDVAPKTFKDKRLADALKAYEKLAEDEDDKRITALDLVIKVAGDYKKLTECQRQVGYLNEVIKEAQAVQQKVKEEKAKKDRELAEYKKQLAKFKDEDMKEAYAKGFADGSTGSQSRMHEYSKDPDILKAYVQGYKAGTETESDLPLKDLSWF
jgi:flagellar biosynthesis/type III secretory pathway protein FliH